MAGEDTGVGVVKIDFRWNDDIVWRGKLAGFAQGVEKCGDGCSGLASECAGARVIWRQSVR